MRKGTQDEYHRKYPMYLYYKKCELDSFREMFHVTFIIYKSYGKLIFSSELTTFNYQHKSYFAIEIINM